MDARRALRTILGFDEFRPGQEQAVEAALMREDLTLAAGRDHVAA